MNSRMNRVGTGIAALLLSAATLTLGAKPSNAFPMFARKFHFQCARCHTMVPRLTPFGYAFLRAGFRLPSNQVKPITFSNSVAMSIVSLTAKSRTSPNISIAGMDTALATSLGKNFAVHVRYTTGFKGGSQSGFSDLWAQYNTGARGTYWTARIGQIPVLDGFNLMGDHRTIAIADAQMYGALGPLANVNAALGDFGLGSYETGVQAGYVTGPLYTRLSWLYGVKEDGSSQNITYNGKAFHDVVLQSEYLIGNQGTSIGAMYYNGRRQLSTIGIEDNFYRAGLFGTYDRFLGKVRRGIPTWQLELNGGLLYGVDDVAAGKPVASYATVIEGDLYFNHKTAFMVRYDSARMAGITGIPVTGQYTFSLANRPAQNLILNAEYIKVNNPGSDSLTGMVTFLY